MNYKNLNIYNFLRRKIRYDLSKRNIIRAKKEYSENFPFVMNYVSTLNFIIENKCSFARISDGEISCIANFMRGKHPRNRCYKEVRFKLLDVLRFRNDNFLLGLYDNPIISSKKSYPKYHFNNLNQCEYQYYKFFKSLTPLIDEDRCYGINSVFNLKFLESDYEFNFKLWYELLVSIWDLRNVVFVRSEEGRFNPNHPMFENVKAKKNVFIEPYDAFKDYNKILDECKSHDRNNLFLIAAGFSSSVLVMDLTILGYQAIDVGHITFNF